jgi:hypothetical protein
MRLLLGFNTNPRNVVDQLCSETVTNEIARIASSTFRDFFSQIGFDPQDDEEFFNGGTWLNTEYDGPNGSGNLRKDAAAIESFYNSVVKTAVLAFPGDQEDYLIESMQDCNVNSIICCYVADRQNDGFGTCKGGNCIDEDPEENTDVCYVNNRNTGFASHIPAGFTYYPDSLEGPVHCEGFAWSDDENDASFRLRGNLLFYLALKSNLYDKGYVRAVPSAPMCGCANKMPIVTKADCIEPVVNEKFDFVFDEDPSVTDQALTSIDFRGCPAGGLSDKMNQLLKTGKISSRVKDQFDEWVVGDGNCLSATNRHLSRFGYVAS